MEGYQPKVLKPSSVGTPAMTIPVVNHEKIVVSMYKGEVPFNGGSGGNGGNDFSGQISFEDCSGGETVTLTWEKGLITSSGAKNVVVGCKSSGS